MKRGFLREKAIFQILVLIVAMVYFSYAMKSVEAASDVCCEKTLSGQYCFYGDSSNCDPAHQYAAVNCEQTSFCKPGCCFDLDEGMCYKSTPLATCTSFDGGEWYADETCDEVQVCQPGCCVIGSQCMFTTEQSCALETAKYPELEMIFHPNILTESECQDVCRAGEQGCCINSDDSCVFETRESCDAEGGDFYKDQYCSDLALCGCTEHHSKTCYDDDVYWVDSCGNREEVAEDCDYASGTICRDVNGEKKCSSVNCEDTYRDDKNVHDPNMGGFRKNGESWCVYESPVGEGLDRPGTRHYRHMCVNGEEIVESCRDYREEICVQGEKEMMTESACLHNDIYDSPITTQVSSVPKGQKFWEDDGQCSEADMDCPVVWVQKRSGSSWNCEANCFCEDPGFIKTPQSGPIKDDDGNDVQGMADVCKFMGDCGADFNILGEFSHEGFSVTGAGRRGPPTTISDAQKQLWDKYGVFGGLKGLYNKIADLIDDILEHGTSGEEEVEKDLERLNQYGMYAIMATVAVVMFIGLSVLTAGIGIVVIALIWYFFMSGDSKTYHVKTTCTPWQPPQGGDDCDKCLDQKKVDELGFYDTCTEYKCKSLGLNCEFISENAGTERVSCFNANPNDVNSPIISPWEEALTTGFSISLINQGYEIKPEVPYYSKIEFGIKTNELAQCKIAQGHTESYESMSSYFGDSFYQMEHNITINPQVGGEIYDYYVRCKDGSGNSNIAEYVIRFVTEDEPDKTAPIVEGTSIDDYGYIESDVNETGFVLYVNEPANCKWSFTDQKYDTMENVLYCQNEPTNALGYDAYACITTLNLTKGLNTYYFRCEDKSEFLNQNQQSYAFHLTGTEDLVIASQSPEGTLYDTVSPTLAVTTANGAEGGKAICYFSDDVAIDVWLWPTFYETDSTYHSQPLLNLAKGNYDYYVRCKDVAANEANTTISFTIDKDVKPPEIEQLYIDSVALHIILDEQGTCEYSNQTFSYGEGEVMSGVGTTHHTVSVGASYYYINCEDVYENHWSNPIIVYL